MALDQPAGDGCVKFVEMAREKVVRVFHDNQPALSGERRDSLLHFLSRAEIVVGAVDE
jgi:hypothetical protein